MRLHKPQPNTDMPKNTFNLNRGDKQKCPDQNCGNVYDTPVEDFSIPGRTGRASAGTERCETCYALFETIENKDGTFTVTLLEEGDLS